MKEITIIFFIIIFLNLILITPTSSQPAFLERKPVSAKRVSQFLLQKGSNPRTTTDQCSKENQVCSYGLEGRNATCCNNRCIETENDSGNCGGCGKKCAFAEVCCRGECVNLAYDKRHCGFCNNVCMIDGNCVYGICDYAV